MYFRSVLIVSVLLTPTWTQLGLVCTWQLRYLIIPVNQMPMLLLRARALHAAHWLTCHVLILLRLVGSNRTSLSIFIQCVLTWTNYMEARLIHWQGISFNPSYPWQPPTPLPEKKSICLYLLCLYRFVVYLARSVVKYLYNTVTKKHI